MTRRLQTLELLAFALIALSALQIVYVEYFVDRLNLMMPTTTVALEGLSLHHDDDAAPPPSSFFVVDNTLFNYTAYWEIALEAALASLQAEGATESQRITTTPRPPCPKVYVYDDLPPNLTDTRFRLPQDGWFSKIFTTGGHNADLITQVYGPKMELRPGDEAFAEYLRDTDQYSFASIMEYRLRTSSQCRTMDPQQADLFFVPVLTAPKPQWVEACRGVSSSLVESALSRYLNSTNACRHFFAFGKGHYNGKQCNGWFKNPSERLRPFQRLAYSHLSFSINNNDTSQPYHLRNNFSVQVRYPNIVSVPYPSSFHYHTKMSPLLPPPQWSSSNNRTLLMSFIGKDNHGDTPVRQRIVQQCLKYRRQDNVNICKHTPKWAGWRITKKAAAVFCLEPAGDSPWRKSLADSITLGCIPVLFSNLTDDVAPWFWGDWKARGRVLVPQVDFLAGRVDLKMLLQSIPPQLLRLMQRTLQEKARQFQYSTDDDQNDGIRVALDGLYRQALDMDRRGVCGYGSAVAAEKEA